MYCKKCHKELSPDAVFCQYCGIRQIENDNKISLVCITSIVMSTVSFLLTTIIRFSVDQKIDLTPSALNYHMGMAVPDKLKPIVMAVPIIFTLIVIIKTVRNSNMNQKEKLISYIFAAFSLFASIAVVNWSYEI